MNGNYPLMKNLSIVLLFSVILLVGCGTFQVAVESTVDGSSIGTPIIETEALSPMAGTATAVSDVPVPAEGIFTITGRAMTIDPSTGMILLLPETESPFANSNGEIRLRISEWARIVDVDDTIVSLNEFSRGIKLELTLLFHDGELTSEDVIVLERGVPPLEENPAYTDATGLVTPLAESVAAGDEAIQLFEIDNAEGIIEPGASLTIRWAFNGESGTLCVNQLPRPVTQTCYPDLPSSGSMQVTIPAEAREAIIYSLYVQLTGVVESADIRVALSEGLGCQHIWYFETDELLGCPVGEKVSLRPQVQTFEQGMMLRLEGAWLGQEPYLIVFIWDEERNEYANIENPLLDTWSSTMSEQVVEQEPPEGLFRPSRGFGLLWSGQMEIPQMGEARTLDGLGLIGWAIEPVHEYDATYQCSEEYFGNSICYLSLPDGTIANLPGQIR